MLAIALNFHEGEKCYSLKCVVPWRQMSVITSPSAIFKHKNITVVQRWVHVQYLGTEHFCRKAR